jgi:phospholipase/lecithinase/hemolysin
MREHSVRVNLRVSVALLVAAVAPVGVAAAEAGPSIHSRAAPRAAACVQWNVTGDWTSIQSNGYHVSFHLVQHGIKLSGTSLNPPREAVGLGYTTGTVTGTVKGDHLNLVAHWQKSTLTGVRNIGNYYGTVSAHHVDGLGRNLAAGVSHATVTWSATGEARCTKH